MTVAKEEDNTA